MPQPVTIDKGTSRELAALRRLPPAKRLEHFGLAIEAHRAAMHQLAALRSETVRELQAEGLSLGAIAKMMGVSRQQAHRLAHGQG